LGLAEGLAVGRGVGLGVGFGVALGAGFAMTTRLGTTDVSVAVRAPEPFPLEAVKRYAHLPTGNVLAAVNVTPP
jgi:hypothetical protein